MTSCVSATLRKIRPVRERGDQPERRRTERGASALTTMRGQGDGLRHLPKLTTACEQPARAKCEARVGIDSSNDMTESEGRAVRSAPLVVLPLSGLARPCRVGSLRDVIPRSTNEREHAMPSKNSSASSTESTVTAVKRLSPSKLKQLLSRHERLREQHSEVFAAVETTEHPLDSKVGKQLIGKRDACARDLHDVAERLRTQGFTLTHDDSAPIPPADDATPEPERPLPSERASLADKPATPPAPKFALPDDVTPRELIVQFLTERSTDERDAAGQGRPFIDHRGRAHIHAKWLREFLTQRSGGDVECPTKVASDMLRELGYKHRSLPVTGAATTRMALWVGDAPRGTGDVKRMPAPERKQRVVKTTTTTTTSAPDSAESAPAAKSDDAATSASSDAPVAPASA